MSVKQWWKRFQKTLIRPSAGSARRHRWRKQIPLAEVQPLEQRVMLDGRPVTSEIRLNTTTGRIQTTDFRTNQTIAALPGGDILAVWQSRRQDGSAWGVYAQRLSADGTKIGGEFRINERTRSSQRAPSLAVADDGRFAVAWQSFRQDGRGNAAMARIFNADGSPGSSEFIVNQTVRGIQGNADLSFLQDGNLVVTWHGSGNSDRFGIYARVFDQNGAAVTNEFPVNGFTRGLQHDPTVAGDSTGGFWIAFSGRGADDRSGVWARRFSADGTPIDDQFRVNQHTKRQQARAAIAASDDGRILLGWQSRKQDGRGLGVFARMYQADGTPIANEFQVNQSTRGHQYRPHLDFTSDGGFAVAWMGRGPGDRRGIFVREYNTDAQPETNQQLVNVTTRRLQFRPSITGTEDGYAVMWAGRGIGDRRGVFARFYGEGEVEAVDPNPVDPNPVDPNPVDPNPVDPNPVDPNPVDPNPVDPNPVDPNPVDPNPVDPNPVDPNPVDPNPVDPNPVDPNPVDPNPVDPNPVDPNPVDPNPVDPNPIVSEFDLLPWDDQTISAGQSFSITPLLSAESGAAERFTITGNVPANSTFDSATGRFEWTPDTDAAGATYVLTFTAHSAQGEADSKTFSITVMAAEIAAPQHAPVLAAIGNQTVEEQTELRFIVSATDLDEAASNLRYALQNAPATAVINPVSGSFTWIPTEADGPGTFTATVIVTDSSGRVDFETISITVIEVNRAPQLAPIADRTVSPGSEVRLVATATDPDLPANTLVFSLVGAFPESAMIDSATGQFVWTPTAADAGSTVAVTVQVQDTASAADQRTFQITVTPSDTTPQEHNPVLAAIGDHTIPEQTELTFIVTATDPDEPASNLRYSLSNAPATATIDPISGRFTWTPTEADGPGTFSATIIVTDSTGRTDHETITISVTEVNQPPTLAAISDRTITEDEVLEFVIVASDNDLPSNELTWSFVGNVPEGVTLNPATGQFRWAPTEVQGPREHIVTVEVKDNFQAAARESFTIHVTETNRPPVLEQIGDHTVAAHQQLAFTASATDPDVPANQLTYSLDEGAPAGATIDPNSGLFRWTPPGTVDGLTAFVTIRVTDNGFPRLSDFETIRITVPPCPFPSGLPDWSVSESGGSSEPGTAIADNCSAVLTEGDSFLVSLSTTFQIPQSPDTLRFTFADLNFDTTDPDFINDSFEAALIGPDGRSLVPSYQFGRDAFFNITEDHGTAVGSGVRVDGSTVTVDVSAVPAGQQATLIFRLANNDADTNTSVRLVDYELTQIPSTARTAPAQAAVTAAASLAGIDLQRAQSAASTGLVADYLRTSFVEATSILRADARVRNRGSFTMNGPVLVGVSHLSSPLVRLLNPDGVTRDGIPYIDVTDLLSDGQLAPGEVSRDLTLSFLNPDRVPFRYELVVFGEVNARPYFTSSPVIEAAAGNTLTDQAIAVDPDGDQLTLSLLAGPEGLTIDPVTGELLWTTTASDVGRHDIRIQADDGRGGLAVQSYVIAVTSGVPNRPPIWTSIPVVEAYVGVPYVYEAQAFDQDADILQFSEMAGGVPAGLTMESATGQVAWLPGPEHVNQLIPVTLQVSDGIAATSQSFRILVLPDPFNHPPVIVTEPDRVFELPATLTGSAIGDVQPGVIRLSLDPGEATSQTVSLTLPQNAYQATSDIIFVIDESASMGPPQVWLRQVIPQVEAALVAAGMTNNRYAISGYAFGHSNQTFRVFSKGVETDVVLYAPDGRTVDSTVNTFYEAAPFGQFILPADGTYTLAAGLTLDSHQSGAAANASNGDFHLIPDVARDADVTVSGLGIHEGWVAQHATVAIPFTANQGMRIGLDLQMAAVPLRYDIRTAQGQPVRSGFLNSLDALPITLPESGSYTLSITGNSSAAAIRYQLELFDFDSPATAIVLNEQSTGTFSTPFGLQRFSFSGTAGQQIFYDALKTVRFDMDASGGDFVQPDIYAMHLISPSGRDLFDTSTHGHPDPGGDANAEDRDRANLVLPESGNYVLVMDSQDPSAVDWDFRLFDVTSFATDLSVGSTASGTLDQASETDVWNLDVQTPGTEYEFRIAAHSGRGGTWSVVDPWGREIASQSLYNSAKIGPIAFNAAGTYRLLISGSAVAYDSATTQSYSLEVTETGFTAVPPVTGTPVIPGTMIQEEISVPGEQDHFVLSIASGQAFLFDSYDSSLEGLRVRLTSPSGVEVLNRDFFADNSTFSFDGMMYGSPVEMPLRLWEPGDYVLTVGTPFAHGTGTYAFEILDPAAIQQLTFGNLNIGTRDAVGEQDHYSFPGRRGDRVVIRRDAFYTASEVTSHPLQQFGGNGTEDGYLATHFGLDLDIRPNAALNVVLITDEDRDTVGVSGVTTSYESLLRRLEAAGASFTSILNMHYFVDGPDVPSASQDPDDMYSEENSEGNSVNGHPALAIDGKTSGSTAWLAGENGGYVTVPFTDLEIQKGFVVNGTHHNDGTEAQYIDLTLELGGLVWDMNFMRQQQAVRDAFTAAFVDRLTTDIIDQASVTLIGSIPDAPFEVVGQSSTDDSVTFDVRFTADGQAHAFDLQFVRTSDHSVLLGSVPTIVSTGYRYDADAVDADMDTLTWQLIGETHGATMDPASGRLIWGPVATGDYQFTARVTDGRGGADLQTWTVSVIEKNASNTAPTLQAAGPFDLETDRAFFHRMMGSDQDQQQLLYQLIDDTANGNPVPIGMTIDSLTGELKWTPTEANAGSQNVIVRVMDGHGGLATQTVTFHVSEPVTFTNSRPLIITSPLTDAFVGQLYRYDVDAIDLDGDVITYSLAAAPEGMSINSADGIIGWHPRSGQIGRHTVIVKATDQLGGIDLQSYDLQVHNLNDPPEITSEPHGPAGIGTLWTYQVRATDPNGDSLTYRLDPSSLARGMSISSAGNISWIPSGNGDYFVRVTVDDQRGGTAWQEFTLPVRTNAAPEITSTPTSPAIVGQPYRYTVVVEDADVGDTYTLTLDPASRNRGLSFDGNDLIWTPNRTGNHNVAVTATDSQGASYTQNFMLQVVAPVVSSAPPIIQTAPAGPAFVGQQWSYTIQAIDPDGDDSALVYSLQAPNEESGVLEFDPGTRTLTWTPDLNDVATGVEFTLRATDESDSWTEQTFTVPVVDLPPEITSIPTGPAVVGQVYEYALTGTDPEGEVLTWNVSSTPAVSGLSVVSTGNSTGLLTWNTPITAAAVVITVTATDAAQNTVSQTFTLPVVDDNNTTLPPDIYTKPVGPIIVGQPWSYLVDATDPDGDDAAITYQMLFPTQEAGILEFDDVTQTLTWTPDANARQNGQLFTFRATDASGSWTQQTFTVFPQAPVPPASEPPRITSVPTGPAIVGDVYTYQANAIDPEGAALSWTVNHDATGETIHIDPGTGLLSWSPSAALTVLITVTATDDALNTATQTFTLDAVVLNNAPTITSVPVGPAWLQEEWSYQVTATDPDAGDTLTWQPVTSSAGGAFNFDTTTGLLTWTPSASATAGTFTLTVKDAAGATSSQTFTVPTARRNQAPEITSLPVGPAVAGERWDYQVTATDADGDIPSFILLTPPLPLGDITFTNGLLTWTPSSTDVANGMEFGIRIEDGYGGYAEQFFTIPVVDPEPNPPTGQVPKFDTKPQGPVYVNEPWQYLARAADDNSSLTYNVSISSPNGTLTIGPTSGILDWIPETTGTYTITLTADDNTHGVGSQSFDVRVSARNHPPVITSEPTVTTTVGELWSYPVRATDPDGDALRFTLDQNSLDRGLQVNRFGRITWSPASVGAFPVTLTVDDGRGETATHTFTLAVNNSSPAITSSPTGPACVGQEWSYQIQATDPDGHTITFPPLIKPAEWPHGFHFDSSTGLITWTPQDTTPLDIELRVEDGFGGRAEQSFTLQVGAIPPDNVRHGSLRCRPQPPERTNPIPIKSGRLIRIQTV